MTLPNSSSPYSAERIMMLASLVLLLASARDLRNRGEVYISDAGQEWSCLDLVHEMSTIIASPPRTPRT